MHHAKMLEDQEASWPFLLFSLICVHICFTIVVAGWSSAAGPAFPDSEFSAIFHLLSTFLFQELHQVALDFTLILLCWQP
jgi:hypothetical protein